VDDIQQWLKNAETASGRTVLQRLQDERARADALRAAILLDAQLDEDQIVAEVRTAAYPPERDESR
jgi:hypothetical protein